MVSENKVAEI